MSKRGIVPGVVFGVFVFTLSSVSLGVFSPGGWRYGASVVAVSLFLGAVAGRFAAGPPDE